MTIDQRKGSSAMSQKMAQLIMLLGEHYMDVKVSEVFVVR